MSGILICLLIYVSGMVLVIPFLIYEYRQIHALYFKAKPTFRECLNSIYTEEALTLMLGSWLTVMIIANEIRK